MRKRTLHSNKVIFSRKWKIQLLFACSVLFFLFLIGDAMLKPAIREAAEASSVYLAMKAINDAVYQKLGAEGILYHDIVSLEKDQNGQVAALHTDIIKINSMKAEISDLVLDALYMIDTSTISIPLGNAFGIDFLSGKGPRIPVEILPIGFATTTCGSEFSSAGINQTKHRITMTVSVSISILLPLDRVTTVVTSDIPVAETVLVGSVPDSYTNIVDTRDLIEQGIDYAME